MDAPCGRLAIIRAQAITKLPNKPFSFLKEKAGAAFCSVVVEEGQPSGDLLQVRNE